MLLRFLLFYVLISLLFLGLGTYVHRRAAAFLRLGPRARKALAALFVAACVLLLSTRLFGRWLSGGAVRVPAAIGGTVALALIISAVLLALVDLARSLARVALRGASSLQMPTKSATESESVSASASASVSTSVTDSISASESTSVSASATDSVTAPAPLPRRSFLAQAATGSALAIGSTSALYGALIGRSDYTLDTVTAPIPGLPRALDGYTLVQISDIHIGLFVGEDELRAAEDLIRSARPDLIVMTGDLIDYDVRYAATLGRFVRRLAPLARDGIAAIPGNHDYYAGIAPILTTLEQAGARVLVNDGFVIGDKKRGLALLGVDDVFAPTLGRGRGPDLDKAIAKTPADLPRVLLCHNPSVFLATAGQVALQLSGHTHGGQVNLGVRPADYVLSHGYVAGLYKREGSLLYVNRGFGTVGPPARIGSPPEITRVVLSAA